MHRPGTHPRRLSTAFVLLSTLLLSPSTHAQYIPRSSSQICSAFIPGQALYVLGGYSFVGNQPLMGQAFAIDLSVSWSTDMPAYKKLASGSQTGVAPCGLSPDGKKWVVITNKYAQSYDIASDQWSDITAIPNFTSGLVTGAVDPDSGNLYVPFGVSASTAGAGMLMFIMNTANPRSYNSDTRSSAPIEQTDFTVAWSTAMKSLIYVGGASIYSYSPLTGWTDLRPLTSGQAPLGSRYYPCVVAGDSKVVVFGGQNRILNQTTLTDIYILDVLNMTWKQGQSVTQDQSRSMGPCAYSNNQFIAWGGVNTLLDSRTNKEPEPVTMVYNLETDTWTNNYTAPPRPAKSTNIGAIVGGVVGGLVVVALIGFGVYRYRKRTHGNKSSENIDEKRPGRPVDPHTNPRNSTARNPAYIPTAASSPGNTYIDHQGYTYTQYPAVNVGSSPRGDHAGAFGQGAAHPHTTPEDEVSKLQDTMSSSPSYYPPPPAMRTGLEGGSSPQSYGVHYGEKSELSEPSSSSIYHPTTSDWRTNPLPPV